MGAYEVGHAKGTRSSRRRLFDSAVRVYLDRPLLKILESGVVARGGFVGDNVLENR